MPGQLTSEEFERILKEQQQEKDQQKKEKAKEQQELQQERKKEQEREQETRDKKHLAERERQQGDILLRLMKAFMRLVELHEISVLKTDLKEGVQDLNQNLKQLTEKHSQKGKFSKDDIESLEKSMQKVEDLLKSEHYENLSDAFNAKPGYSSEDQADNFKENLISKSYNSLVGKARELVESNTKEHEVSPKKEVDKEQSPTQDLGNIQLDFKL